MSLRQHLEEPVDSASLGFLRAFFGLVMALAAARTWAYGWIDALYVAPPMFFPFEGFTFIHPWPAPWMHLHFAVMGIAAVGVMVGLVTRLSSAIYLGLFAWVEGIDKTPYLNHYYLVTLLALWMVLLPAGGTLSVDARWRPVARVPRWMVWVLRFQVGLVYFFAGVTKLGWDWIGRAQPLRLWLAAKSGMPVIGALLREAWVGFAMAWGGLAFDLLIPFALCSPRLRAPAWGVLVVFHLVTGALFPIGIFPVLMVGCTTIFFAPTWPRRLLPTSWFAETGAATAPLVPWRTALLSVYAGIQLLGPLRSHAMTSDVLWTERGFRWAWRVLIVEKLATLELHVRDIATGAESVVRPVDRMTPYQAKMVATQPDMILQFAHALRDEAASKGQNVAIHAESWVSFNGRPMSRYVRPDVDLSTVEDGWGERWWLAPRPEGDAP